jgi:hypothetical protein
MEFPPIDSSRVELYYPSLLESNLHQFCRMEFSPIDSSRLVLPESTRVFSNGVFSNRLETTRVYSSLLEWSFLQSTRDDPNLLEIS